MHFVVRKTLNGGHLGEALLGWEWTLAGTAGDVARSPRSYASEADARSAIAAAKKSMQAVRFAKVVSA